jgi:hypothetical protein
MLLLAAPEGAYANAALFIALARKLMAKGIISKEEMLGIFDDAATFVRKCHRDASGAATSSLATKGTWNRRGDEGRRPSGRGERARSAPANPLGNLCRAHVFSKRSPHNNNSCALD